MKCPCVFKIFILFYHKQTLYAGILQYGSEKVQYIGTKNISQYIVFTINRTIRK